VGSAFVGHCLLLFLGAFRPLVTLRLGRSFAERKTREILLDSQSTVKTGFNPHFIRRYDKKIIEVLK
jgi:hypothetical protein